MNSASLKGMVLDYRRNLLWDDLAGMWGAVLFFRLPGFLVARAAISLGVSPTLLTISGLAITALIVAAGIVLPAWAAIPAIAILGACFQIVDCADGTVARTTSTTSTLGRFLDFASDILWRAVCLAAIGNAADVDMSREYPSSLVIGLTAGLFATYARLIRTYTKSLRAGAAPSIPTKTNALARVPYAFLSGLDELFPLLALIAWACGWLDSLLVYAAVYHGADAIIAVCSSILVLRLSDQHRDDDPPDRVPRLL